MYQVSEVFWGVLGVSQGGSWRPQGGTSGGPKVGQGSCVVGGRFWGGVRVGEGSWRGVRVGGWPQGEVRGESR